MLYESTAASILYIERNNEAQVMAEIVAKGVLPTFVWTITTV